VSFELEALNSGDIVTLIGEESDGEIIRLVVFGIEHNSVNGLVVRDFSSDNSLIIVLEVDCNTWDLSLEEELLGILNLEVEITTVISLTLNAKIIGCANLKL